MMDAIETPVERMKALAKMARGEYDHRDFCGEDAADTEWLCHWCCCMMNTLIMVDALPPFKTLNLGTYGRVRRIVRDTVLRFNGKGTKPVETTADVLRRLASDLDKEFDANCGRVAVDLINIGVSIVRENWLRDGVAQCPMPIAFNSEEP